MRNHVIVTNKNKICPNYMSRRRVFSSNIEVTMGDHIKTVAQTAKQGKYIRPVIPAIGVPTTLLEGVTSYIDFPLPSRSQCQLNKIYLYPYGHFYQVANPTKFVFV